MSGSRFNRLRTSFNNTIERRRSRSSSDSPSPSPSSTASSTPQQPEHSVPSERYSVTFTSKNLGLRLERSIFSTRGAYVTGFTTNNKDNGMSTAGMAREIRVGDNLLACNNTSLLVSNFPFLLETIAQTPRPTTILFEKQSANRAGFAAIIRRGPAGIVHFLDFILLKSKKDLTYANIHRPAFLFYIEAMEYQNITDSNERDRKARHIFHTFLQSKAIWYIPPSIIRDELRANIAEIFGLVTSKLLNDTPLDIFDECMCSVAENISCIVSPFCKSASFQHVKEKRPAFTLTLQDILRSRRALNFYMCYLLQTKSHAPLLLYLDIHNLDIQFEEMYEKYFASNAPLKITCVAPSSTLENKHELLPLLVACLEQGSLTRFIHSNICFLLMGPSEEMGDLSNILEVSELYGMNAHRRPTPENRKNKATSETKTNQTSSIATEDLLGLTLTAAQENVTAPSVFVDACVLFETNSDGNIKIVETLTNTTSSSILHSPPDVSPFFIPHGIDSDLDYQETKREEHDDDQRLTEDVFPGSFAMSLFFPSPGGDETNSWYCNVLCHPSEPSTTATSTASTSTASPQPQPPSTPPSLLLPSTPSLTPPIPPQASNKKLVNRLVPSGVALFSRSPCSIQLRKRLGTFAMEYPPNNSTNGSKTTLFDNVRACQTTLLADINEFDAKEDSMTYMTMVLEKLQPKLLLDLFTCALLERKILLVSKSYTMLTATASVIKSLLYPLKWSNVCIAVLPRSMLETLECPTPFIMGIHSSYAFKRDFPFVLDLVVVNLDLGTLTQQQANAEMLDENEEADELYFAVNEAIRAPPSRSETILIQKVKDALCCTSTGSDSVLHWPPTTTNPAFKIKQLFQQHVENLLKDVSLCYVAMAHGRESVVVFDRQSYISRHASDQHPLLKALVQTGCFNRYLTDTARSAVDLSSC